MRSMTASEASRNFSTLLDAVEQGETVVISRAGKPIATIQPTIISSGDAFANVLRSWNGSGYDDDDLEHAIAEMRELVSHEHDVDPWAD